MNRKIRIQKHLSNSGFCSRRKAEELIAAGKIKVNGRVASLGDSVDPYRDKITVSGKRVINTSKKMYVMLHKPRGYVTTMNDEQDRKCVAALVADAGERLFPVGRLDRKSEGLLIMTNDGELANRLMHPAYHVSKVYRVTVREKVSDEQLVRLSSGMKIDGENFGRCDVTVLQSGENRTVLRMVLYEGKNREIRRMCEAVGLTVIRLKRTEIAGIKLGMLPPGEWRELNEKELRHISNISISKEAAEYAANKASK